VPMKAPSFPCYVNNILGSGRIATMTNAEFGAYWMLLCRAWNEEDCALPDDDAVLAAWSRCNGDWPVFRKRVLERCFTLTNGRWVNARLLACRREREEFARACSTAGRVGATRRWHGGKGGGK
jgi:uncharacterized protein YdaU (DUF1376 family)